MADTESTSREITRRIVEALAPERIYLFGSRARGDARPDSDWDVLVVVAASQIPGHRRDAVALRALRGLRVSVDVLVLTREEFEGKLDVLCSLPATVAREGRLIYAAA